MFIPKVSQYDRSNEWAGRLLYWLLCAALALVASALWPNAAGNGVFDWNTSRWSLGFTGTLRPNLRLLMLVAVGGGIGSALRTTLNSRVRRGNSLTMTPWTGGLGVVFGAVSGTVAWLAIRVLRVREGNAFSGVSPLGLFAVTVAAGYFAPDLRLRLLTVYDELMAHRRSREPSKVNSSEAGGQEAAAAAEAGVEAERLKRRFARSPDDISIARLLIAALRDAGKTDEAASSSIG